MKQKQRRPDYGWSWFIERRRRKQSLQLRGRQWNESRPRRKQWKPEKSRRRQTYRTDADHPADPHGCNGNAYNARQWSCRNEWRFCPSHHFERSDSRKKSETCERAQKTQGTRQIIALSRTAAKPTKPSRHFLCFLNTFLPKFYYFHLLFSKKVVYYIYKTKKHQNKNPNHRKTGDLQ